MAAANSSISPRTRHRARQEAVRRQFANVQPNSGSQMNQAVFLALLQPGDTFMGLDLAFRRPSHPRLARQHVRQVVQAGAYTVRKDDQILDMDAIAKQAEEVKPKLIIAGGSAYSRSGTSSASARSPTASAPICWSTWPISPASLPVASILAGAACPCRHDDHAQVAARPARRHDPHQ
jgi:hypothetical protein